MSPSIVIVYSISHSYEVHNYPPLTPPKPTPNPSQEGRGERDFRNPTQLGAVAESRSEIIINRRGGHRQAEVVTGKMPVPHAEEKELASFIE